MIRFLRIRNLAVIDTLGVEFEPGFNVLTGETGAGKSILVEAIALLLGGRASPDLVRTGQELATVEAIIETASGHERLIRREISSQGRSRAFVDEALVTVAALKDLAADLVDIHGQHEHQGLLSPETHLDVLDAFAGLTGERAGLAERFAALARARATLDSAQLDERERAARIDLLSYQVQELDRAALDSGEEETLAAERRRLSNADRLARLCGEAYETLYGGEAAVLGRLGGVWRQLAELASLDPTFSPYAAERDDIKARLEDLAHTLREYGARLDASPARLQQVEDRLALVERLKRKYGPSLTDVLARGVSARADLAALQNSTAKRASLQAALDEEASRYLAVAHRVSEARRQAADRLARALERGVADLAMERTRCAFRFSEADPPASAWTALGIDAAELLMSPNPGEELRPLARIASGGELSRVMLALKTIASTDAPGKTLIFDEVDAGIGGRVADIVGARLRALGDRTQVLCITHLPQIAAYSTTHFQVSKRVDAGRTVTDVRRLSDEERADVLAGMIGGRNVTPAIRASAVELLRARAGESESKITAKGESETPATRQAKAKGKRVG